MASPVNRYLGNVLEAASSGCQLDFRFRIALELLKSPWAAAHEHQEEPRLLAASALSLASELVHQSEDQGLLLPLPEDDGITPALRAHIRRNLRAQAYQGVQGQKIAAEEMPKVEVAPPALRGLPR
jgi:hypothetical protein